jgi:hypothetical protein
MLTATFMAFMLSAAAPASASNEPAEPTSAEVGTHGFASQRPELTDLKYGFHLGLNATLSFDARIGQWFYGEVSTQLTGLAAMADPKRGYVLSALLFGGVAIPLIENSNLRLTLDVGAHGTYLHSVPENLLAIGVLAGLRIVHHSGFTFAFKLPLIGFAGSPDIPRGGLLYYYMAAIITVPVITFGYTF